MIRIKNADEVRRIAESCRIISEVFKEMEKNVEPGVTTRDLEAVAESVIARHGGIPAFKGYRGYPGAICASVNEEVVHGIPGDRVLKDGDVVSLDVGVIKDGYYGDAARSFAAGILPDEKRDLMERTEAALLEGIKQAVPGNSIRDISVAIQKHVEAGGYAVVRDLVGHGVGKELHEEPQIPNFAFRGPNPKIREGMTLAIEPMVNAGDYRVRVLADGWTVVTADGSCSAHCEDTVAVGSGGPVNLTRPA